MANESTNSSFETYFEDEDALLTGLQKQWVDRVYGGTILLLNIVIMMYLIRILKGSASSEKGHFVQLVYIGINDSIIGAILIAIGMIYVDDVPSAYMCSSFFVLLGGFNATSQLNIMFACIQRYTKIKRAHLSTEGWKMTYTQALQVFNAFVAVLIMCVLFLFASTTATRSLKGSCWLNKMNAFVRILLVNVTWVFTLIPLITADVLLILTFKTLKKPEMQRSSSLPAQRKIVKTLICMTVCYNVSLLSALVSLSIKKLTAIFENNIAASFSLWFLFVNSLLNPIIPMTRVDKVRYLIRHDMRLLVDTLDIPFGIFRKRCLRRTLTTLDKITMAEADLCLYVLISPSP